MDTNDIDDETSDVHMSADEDWGEEVEAAEPGPWTPGPAPITLHPDQRENGSPNLSFTWRLKPEARQALREKDARYPRLLVIVAQEVASRNRLRTRKLGEGDLSDEEGEWRWQEVQRETYPLTQGMGLIQFTRPGTFKVLAALIPCAKAESARDAIRDTPSYVFSDTDERGSRIVNDFDPLDDMNQPHAIELMMKIDQSLFAVPKSNWMMSWTGLWFEGKPRDECALVKRAIVAFSIQPIAIALWLIFRTLLAIAGGICLKLDGWRNVKWSVILHPFRDDLTDMRAQYAGPPGTNSFTRYTKDGKRRAYLEQALFTPLIWIGGIALVIASIHWPMFGWKLLISIGSLVAIVALAITAVYLYERSLGKTPAEREATRRRRDEESARKRLEAYYRAHLDPLVCTPTTDAQPHRLPKTHRTWAVRFLEKKAKTCLPFAS